MVGITLVSVVRGESDVVAAPSSVFSAEGDVAGDHRYTNYREPVVVRTNSGKLVLGVHAGNRLAWPERSGQDLAVRISSDKGETWGPIIVAAEHGNFSAQSHGMVYDAQKNRLFFLYVTYNWDYSEAKGRGYGATAGIYEKMHQQGKASMSAYLVYSDDEGTTWSAPRDLSDMTGGDAHFGASEGRQLTVGAHSGRLILAGGDERNMDSKGKVIGKNIGAWISDDYGETWTFFEINAPAEITGVRNLSCEARISELPDGTLLYNQRTRTSGRQLSWSKDGGATWSETRHAAELKTTQCNGCTITLRDAEGFLTDMVLFSVPSPGGRSEGLIYVSRDGGRSWPTSKKVVSGAFAYSALIQLDSDTVGLFSEANHHRDICFVVLPIADLLSPNSQGDHE